MLNQVDKNMKSRYESSGNKLAIDNSVKISMMVIPMHGVMLHYADDAIILLPGETIKMALESALTEGIVNVHLLRSK